MSSNKKRHVLEQINLSEISLVDEPANKAARVALLKRGDMAQDDMTAAEKRRMKELMDKGMDEKRARSQTLRELRKSDGGPDSSASTQDDPEENTMDVKELKTQLEGLEAQNAALISALGEAGFSVSKADDGKVSVEKQAEPEYIEIDGQRVEKSAVPEPLLKRLERQTAEIERLSKAQEETALAKRGEAELPNLSGDALAKGRLLKAVDGMDEASKKQLSEALKAADAAVSKVFSEVGKASGGDDDTSPSAQLNKKATEYAQANNVSFEKAWAEITKSGEGAKLAAEIRKSGN